MCYEFSEWSLKLRVAQLARKEPKAVNPEKKPDEPVTPAQPVTREIQIEERESVPV